MKRVLTAMAVALLLSSCRYAPQYTPNTYAANPAQLRERARALKTEAAALRKDAEDYAALLERSGDTLKAHEVKLRAARRRKAELDGRVASLRKQQADASQDEARRLGVTLSRYETEAAAVQAKIDDELVRIRHVKGQMEWQAWVRQTYLQQAARREKEAAELEKLAGAAPAT